MDRTLIYSQEQARTFDILNAFKDSLKGIGNSFQALVGSSQGFLSGFSASQQTIPNLTINLAAGQIYQLLAIDSTPYGALAADATLIEQQGVATQQVLTFTTAGLVAGQSQWVLVSGAFAQTDAVRTGDPSGGVLPYYNSLNPTQPLQGPGGSGAVQNTVRQGAVAITITYGTPATTGSQVPPAVPANNLPMYLILLTFGQTTITNGQILVAGNSAYAGYQQAPFLAGLTNSHHNGLAGQAPQISLTQEVQGILPLANCPGTSTYTDHSGALAVIRNGTGNPNGVLAGNVGDIYLDRASGIFWGCSVTGSTSTAVWVSQALPPVTIVSAFPFTVPSNLGTYLLNCSGNSVVNLPTAVNPAWFRFKRIDSTPSTCIITPFSGAQLIDGAANYQLNVGRDALEIMSEITGANWYIV